MKKELTSVATNFFDSKDVYEHLSVPWKRDLMRVFQQARALSPCMLIFKDIETIVTPNTRSHFFNEMDGLGNNDGLFVVASTNYLERLDAGLTSRPSRFDMEYHFPILNEHERLLCCEYWRNKLKKSKIIDFSEILTPAIAHIPPGSSFAFLQEFFVASLLVLACTGQEKVNKSDDLNQCKLWTVFKKQAYMLRKEIGNPEANMLPVSVQVHSQVESQAAADRGPNPTDTLTQGLQGLSMPDEMLLVLQQGKYRFVNSAASDWKLQ
ncbi:Hypothetical protein R9X50_00656900 [Acrodontium crateriforme]|uniref:ATPase AAA-type core domain-containing protein n=1 Tax=Acrodontium crateriforme TaxID=150365 RepID=A0AAQ3MBU3_9PEZI|nr:Hypothetical protein R9X50_00656900 [Acrodontium crateriforme]